MNTPLDRHHAQLKHALRGLISILNDEETSDDDIRIFFSDMGRDAIESSAATLIVSSIVRALIEAKSVDFHAFRKEFASLINDEVLPAMDAAKLIVMTAHAEGPPQ